MASALRRVLRSTGAGALRRCPSCRQGPMYQGMYAMHDSCTKCGYRFEPSPGEFTGGLMLAQGLLGVVAVVGALILYLRGASMWLLYAWLGVILVLVPVLFYPNIKGAWLGFLHGVRAKGAR